MKNEKFDYSKIVANIDKVKEMKKSRPKKPSTSMLPLKFEESPDDSPLKAEIIRRINAKNLTYSSLYNYCTKLKNNDPHEGQTAGYNIITGLRKRHTMIDTTFSMLCDFLNLDIVLIDRSEDTEDEDDESFDEEE